MKARWSIEDFKKAGLIETTDGFVPGERLVDKGKVEKLPSLLERSAKALDEIHRLNKTMEAFNIANPLLEKPIKTAKPTSEQRDVVSLNIDLFLNGQRPTPEQLMQQIAERGITYGNWSKQALYTITLPTGEELHIKYEFNIAPCPAPRMTRSDQWKTDPYHANPDKRQRKAVAKYFDWRDTFRQLCAEKGFVLGEVLRVVFIIPVPQSLSRKKREMRMGQAHKQRPDTDNCIKSIKDSFNVDDGYVWDERGIKIWGETGKILFF